MQIDFKLLDKQKQSLYELLPLDAILKDRSKPIQGICNLLDTISDADFHSFKESVSIKGKDPVQYEIKITGSGTRHDIFRELLSIALTIGTDAKYEGCIELPNVICEIKTL